MRQVVIVSLGNNAYHIEEEGYRALQTYLDRARRGLQKNPDADEILGDLERAIAEKCSAVVNDTKNVVTAEDVARILQEIGPVVGEVADAPPVLEAEGPGAAKTFRRRSQGAAIAGVCSGLAHYFDVDVLIVRLAFVGLTLVSGAGLLLYIIMAFVVPGDDGRIWERKFSKLAMAALIVFMVVIFSASVSFGRHGFGLGFPEIFLLFVPLAFFGLLAVIAGAVVILVVKHLRTSPR